MEQAVRTREADFSGSQWNNYLTNTIAALHVTENRAVLAGQKGSRSLGAFRRPTVIIPDVSETRPD